MICPYCESEHLQKRGFSEDGKRQRFRCSECHRWPTGDIEITPSKLLHPAKILLLDVETLPMWVKVWNLRNNDYISPKNIVKDWCILSWSSKWLCDSKIEHDYLTSQEALDRDDSRCIQRMWELLDEADICVGHNSVRYDHKKLNTQFIVHGLPKPMFYRTVDTLQVAKQNFSFSSNGIDFINKKLGIHQKEETDMNLWDRCDEGDIQAIKRMSKYNDNDVQILEELYLKFRPWMGNHPSLKTYITITGDICICGSTNLTWGGWYRTNQNRYRAFRCECGAIGRSSKSERVDR